MFPGITGTEPVDGLAAAPVSDVVPVSLVPTATFVCPGNETPISRSVHLSRLRRGFEECCNCPHREQIGHLSSAALRSFGGGEAAPSSLIRDGAIRGVYLNELTRPTIAGLAEAVAAMLWDDLGGLTTLTSKPCPVVVVGRDTRPMSADLAAGAVTGLRRMGCHVIEVGEVTRPEFWFATRHLEAFAGVWINGVGTDANGSGLDIIQGGRCWSSPGRLDELMVRRNEAINRPSDRNGTLATFQTTRPYLAGLRKHYHAFRPLNVLFSCRERLVEGYLKSLLEDSPIQARWDSHGSLFDAADETQLKAGAIDEVYAQRLDAVIGIDEDAQTCRLWDERGRPVSPLHLLRPLRDVIDRRRLVRSTRLTQGTVDVVRSEAKRHAPEWLQARAALVRPHGKLDSPVSSIPTPKTAVRDDDAPREIETLAKSPLIICTSQLPDGGSLGTDVISAENTLEAMSRAMSEHEARLGLDWRGAFWFDEAGPTSDALLTVARVLQLLSQSDHPLSRLWAE